MQPEPKERQEREEPIEDLDMDSVPDVLEALGEDELAAPTAPPRRREAKPATAPGAALPARGLARPHGRPSFRDPKPPVRLEDLVGRDVEVRLVGPSGPLRGELVAVGKTDLLVSRHGSRLAMIARSAVLAVLDEGAHPRRDP